MNKVLARSLMTLGNPFNSTDEVVTWIERRNREVVVRIEEVPFADLKGWHFDGTTGNLVHDSGKFFSIVGIDVRTNTGSEKRWTQPVINQPEVGYLGIICKEFDGVLYFLLQAKIEPGNVNCVQLSPTLQATRSNYTRYMVARNPPIWSTSRRRGRTRSYSTSFRASRVPGFCASATATSSSA